VGHAGSGKNKEGKGEKGEGVGCNHHALADEEHDPVESSGNPGDEGEAAEPYGSGYGDTEQQREKHSSEYGGQHSGILLI
jgi:hypothetical protein